MVCWHMWIKVCIVEGRLLQVFWKIHIKPNIQTVKSAPVMEGEGNGIFRLSTIMMKYFVLCVYSDGVGPWESPVQPGSPYTEFRAGRFCSSPKMLTQQLLLWDFVCTKVCYYILKGWFNQNTKNILSDLALAIQVVFVEFIQFLRYSSSVFLLLS